MSRRQNADSSEVSDEECDSSRNGYSSADNLPHNDSSSSDNDNSVGKTSGIDNSSSNNKSPDNYEKSSINDENASDTETDDEDLLDIIIETLTGTTFQVRVSPWETVSGLKNLLHRTQGLNAKHQHILRGSTELEDEIALIDQNVMDGSTLKLVLGMTGGPLNVRKIYHETSQDKEPRFKELHKNIEITRQQQIEEGGKPVTLLVFKDSSAVNVYRIQENADGTFSPLNRSSAEKSSHARTGHSTDRESTSDEKTNHKLKMQQLSEKMTAVKLHRKAKRKRKSVKKSPSSCDSRHSQSRVSSVTRIPRNSSKSFQLEKAEEFLKNEIDIDDKKAKSTHRKFIREEDKSEGDSLQKMSKQSVRSVEEGITSEFNNEQTSTPRNVFENLVDKIKTPKAKTDRSLPENFGKKSDRSFSLPPVIQSRTIKFKKNDFTINNRRFSMYRSLSKLPKNLPKIMAQNPADVQFSRHPKLSAIQSQRERKLNTLVEDCDSSSEILSQNNRANFENVTNSSVSKYLNSPPPNGRNAPHPMYKAENDKNRGGEKLYKSYDSATLKSRKELDFRPSTSPEKQWRQSPRKYSTESFESDKNDEKLKELLNLLNSRASSRCSEYQDVPILNNLSNSMKSSARQSLKSSANIMNRKVSCIKNPQNIKNKTQNSNNVIKNVVQNPEPENAQKLTITTNKNGSKARVRSGKLSSARGTKSAKKKTPKPKCNECKKKIGIVNTYTCRCGKIFCSQHRYPETHICTYDYRTEGRKLLEISNPVVVPPKLPKL